MDAATCSVQGGVCTSDSTSLEDLAIYGAAAVVAMGLSTILALQLDGVSRWFLSPDSLLAKRRREYKYAIEQGSEYTSLMIRQHVGGGKKLYDPKTESNVWMKIGSNDTEEMDTLISETMDPKKATPVIVAIEQDLGDENNPNEYHLFLAFPPTASAGISTPAAPNLYQKTRVPLIAFCDKLAKAFKDQMTSTALCFVADASSGMGSELLTDVVKDANHGVATVSNPAWMTMLALIVSNNTQNITTQQFETIIFALCRLDAFRVRESVGVSRTVLFSLPGQACVPRLLPLIQKVFVHERHLFVYDGCCHSVEYGLGLINKYGASYRQKAPKEEWDLVSETPKVISATLPMAPLRHNRALPDTLANLNGSQASIVEAWMASVDVFLDMKAKEKKNFYTPFVCRAGFLMKRSGIGNGDGTDLSELALKNVLEFISGSKSRALGLGVLEAAQSSLKRKRGEFEEAVQSTKLKPEEKILIEKCVFTHKSILIGEKTLLDTVQPKEDWSLKAAKKLKSCLCCLPGEGDEEEEDESDEEGEAKTETTENARSVMDQSNEKKAGRSNYVDGKTQFAFDPTMFS